MLFEKEKAFAIASVLNLFIKREDLVKLTGKARIPTFLRKTAIRATIPVSLH
jgi:hypothetical protein